MVEVVILSIFLGRLKTQPFYEIKDIHSNSYVEATIPTYIQTPKHPSQTLQHGFRWRR